MKPSRGGLGPAVGTKDIASMPIYRMTVPIDRMDAKAPRAHPYSGLSALFGLLMLACVLTACGSGGTQPTVEPEAIDLGLLSSTAPSSVVRTFRNPLSTTVTMTSAASEGPFAFASDALPTSIVGGGSVDLAVVFSPAIAGPAEDTLPLRFDDGSTVVAQDITIRATAEAVQTRVTPTPVVFGQVAPNTTADRDVTVHNTSVASTLVLTTATLPNERLSILASPFPLSLAPGELITFTVQYAPETAGDDGGNLILGASDPGGPVPVPIAAGTNGPGSEDVTDFGTQALDGTGFTQQLSVEVPADAISLTLEGLGTESDQMGLGELIGPNSRVFENQQLTGNYIWVPGTHAFATTVPNTDRGNVQLDGPGTYLFRIIKLSGPSTSISVRAIVERRSAGFESIAVLPLNIWLADGLSVDAASAPTDGNLQNTLNRIDTILSGQGIRLGAISYYDVTDPDFDDVTSNQEFGDLLQLTSGASEERLNLFFVETALGGGVVGVSATISGPKIRGTALSGVMSIYSSNATFVGLVAAHEIGHFCGLYHTVEQAGGNDFVDDTLDCPADGSTNGTCTTPGGSYLMHWQALGGVTLTNGQGLVLRAHPLMAPGTFSGPTKARRPAGAMDAVGLERFRGLADGWCGTCRGRTGPKGE